MNTKIEQNRQGFDRKVAQIRGYADLTDEVKRRMLSEAYEETAGRHREIVEERERQAASSAARLLFGTGDHGPINPAELDGHASRPSRGA